MATSHGMKRRWIGCKACLKPFKQKVSVCVNFFRDSLRHIVDCWVTKFPQLEKSLGVTNGDALALSQDRNSGLFFFFLQISPYNIGEIMFFEFPLKSFFYLIQYFLWILFQLFHPPDPNLDSKVTPGTAEIKQIKELNDEKRKSTRLVTVSIWSGYHYVVFQTKGIYNGRASRNREELCKGKLYYGMIILNVELFCINNYLKINQFNKIAVENFYIYKRY